MDWRRQFERELNGARIARSRGNEGRARVCARRAAGIAVREYLSRSGRPVSGSSVLDLYDSLRHEQTLSPDARKRVDRLALRVDRDFKLPADVDLVEDARVLAQMLLGTFPDPGDAPP